MLTLHENAQLSRRELLRIGSLTLGGLSLANLLAANAAAEPASSSVGDRSVIFLFQQGGPPQFDTYDPKPDAAAEVRTITGITQTALPGVYFGDTLQQLARRADRLT